MSEFNERQKQAIAFVDLSIARCYQEKLSAVDVVLHFINAVSIQLEQEGLKLFVGTNSDVVYRDGLLLEARQFIQHSESQEREDSNNG